MLVRYSTYLLTNLPCEVAHLFSIINHFIQKCVCIICTEPQYRATFTELGTLDGKGAPLLTDASKFTVGDRHSRDVVHEHATFQDSSDRDLVSEPNYSGTRAINSNDTAAGTAHVLCARDSGVVCGDVPVHASDNASDASMANWSALSCGSFE